MTTERESLPELTKSRTIVESKLSSAQDVLDNIATPGYSNKKFLKLDPAGDIDIFVDNLDRVTAIQERLVTSVIPTFQGELSSLNQTIKTLTSAHVERLNVLRERYQRIEGRLETGLHVPAELLTPITTEIQRLEEFINTGRGEVVLVGSQAPVAPEKLLVVLAEPPEPASAEPVEIPPVESIPTPEAEKLPLAKINRKEKKIELNGKINNFSDIQWDALMIIIKTGLEGILTQDLEKTLKDLNPQSRSHMGAIIHNLREKFEDLNNPKIITSEGPDRYARYFFNAEVQFAPSSIVIFENMKKIFVDNREIELTREEMDLLKILAGKSGEFITSRTLSTQALGVEDPVAVRMSLKMANLAKKINYSYGDKLIDSKMASMNSGYKLQNVEIAIDDETLKQDQNGLIEGSEEEKRLKALANIVEIQRLIDEGILSNPEQIAKAQEMARVVGGTIEFQEPFIESTRVESAPEDEQKPNLTPDLAVSLVGLIQHKAREGVIIKVGDRSIKFRLDDKTSKVFEDIIDRYIPENQEINGQYSKLRDQALIIVEKIIRNENRDILIDSHEDPDIKFLLTYFCIPDNPEMEKFLIEFLRAEDPESIPVLDKQRWVDTIRIGIWKPAGVIEPMVKHFIVEESIPEDAGTDSKMTTDLELGKERKPVEEDIFALPSGEEFIIRASKTTIDTFKFILESYLLKLSASSIELANKVYEKEIQEGLSLLKARHRVSANVITINNQLEESSCGFTVINISRSRSIPAEYVLKEIEKSREEVVEQGDNGGQVYKPITLEDETTKKPQKKQVKRQKLPGTMNSREFSQYASSKGFLVEPGGSGDFKVTHNGKLICTLSSRRAGGRSLSIGTYRHAIKEIDKHLNSIAETEQSSDSDSGD